jgi:diadenosine tetraphosphate (Ap4A) HIT family hydrolase
VVNQYPYRRHLMVATRRHVGSSRRDAGELAEMMLARRLEQCWLQSCPTANLGMNLGRPGVADHPLHVVPRWNANDFMTVVGETRDPHDLPRPARACGLPDDRALPARRPGGRGAAVAAGAVDPAFRRAERVESDRDDARLVRGHAGGALPLPRLGRHLATRRAPRPGGRRSAGIGRRPCGPSAGAAGVRRRRERSDGLRGLRRELAPPRPGRLGALDHGFALSGGRPDRVRGHAARPAPLGRRRPALRAARARQGGGHSHRVARPGAAVRHGSWRDPIGRWRADAESRARAAAVARSRWPYRPSS